MTSQLRGDKPSVEPERLEEEEALKPPTPLDRLRQILNRARQWQQPVANRKELERDRSKSLFLLVAAAVVVLLVFLALFSSPQKPRQMQTARRATPALGRRVTPGQQPQGNGSVTPLLSADTRELTEAGGDQVTPEDINRTSRQGVLPTVPRPAAPANMLPPSTPTAVATSQTPVASRPGFKNHDPKQYALKHIDFSDPALQQEYAKAGSAPTSTVSDVRPARAPESNDLKKPSLVFVRQRSSSANVANTSPGTGARSLDSAQISLGPILPAGTRLVAPLQAAANTTLAAPVFAVIEYNYERDGLIVVPAGSKALGKLQQANSSGYVSLHFEALDLPDGTRAKIDGSAMGLDFGPLKGIVTGKKRGTKFLVQTLTGVGTAAAYLVGARNLQGQLSESALMRERLADNIAIASQAELNQLAFNQNVSVTVPGNTRFYVVLQQEANPAQAESGRRVSLSSRPNNNQSLPSLQELRQLLQLKQELSRLYQEPPNTQAAQDPQR